jgi:hypothetical protein
MEQNQIVKYLLRLNQSEQTVALVNQIEKELSVTGETHLAIELQFALILHRNGLVEESYNKLMYILECEVNNENFTYNTVYADAVGIACSFLIDNYYRKSSDNYQQLFDFGFIYLSNHIQNYGYQMFDSLYHRATLLDSNHSYSRSLGSRFLKSFSFIPLPMIISDYFYSAQSYILNNNLQFGKKLTLRADYLHNFLDDITINGQDADKYSLKEMAQLGKERINSIFNQINVKEELAKFDFNSLL